MSDLCEENAIAYKAESMRQLPLSELKAMKTQEQAETCHLRLVRRNTPL
jgi:hypothetical protein